MTTKIASRFAVSLLANLVRSGVMFGTAILLARWLGPTDFGRMTFLLVSFTALRGMLDMGSASAFFTLLSRRQRSGRFITIFWSFIAIQLAVALLFLLVFLPDSLLAMLWAGESRMILALAFLAAFMQGTVWILAAQMAEASRQTIRVQQINTVVIVVQLVVVIVLAYTGALAIPLVFAALVIEWAAAAWLASRLYAAHLGKDGVQDIERETPKSVFLEFFVYCLPLIPTTLLGFVHDFADRWMLQTWGGSKEQAYFSVAQQYSAVALLATVSVLRILWKEIAESHYKKDSHRVWILYRRASRLLFFVGAFLAGGMQPLASELLDLSVGEAYINGAMTMAIMFLYPVHQSLGQISGTMLFATGHTKAYAISSAVSILVSLIVVYFMLAPTTAPLPGLQLGAEGLAIKLVGVQIFSVNLMGWMIARTFGWRFEWTYQAFGLLGCVALGWLAHYVAWQIIGENGFILVKLLLMGLTYVSLVGVYVYFFPWLVSMTRGQLVETLVKLRMQAALKLTFNSDS